MPSRFRVPGCWLWPEAGSVRWCTPSDTGLLDVRDPTNDTCRVRLAELRDHGTEITLKQALDPELAELLCGWLNGAASVRLHLDEKLPASWHEIPWEWLHHDGATLHGRLLAIRHAIRSETPALVASRGHAGAVFDLWPDGEVSGTPRRFGDLAVPGLIQVYRGVGPVNAFLRSKALSAFPLVCIVAHGSERSATEPVRLADGALWSLPEDEPIPSVVVLLVCGSDERNLTAYGCSLLSKGAAAVLAPVGRIDAAAADAFLRRLLTGWCGNERLGEILCAGQTDPESADAARRIELLGRGDLRFGGVDAAGGQVSASPVRDAHAGNPAALVALADRLTLDCMRDAGDLTDAVDRLFDALGLRYGDPSDEERLLRQLDATESALQPLTRAWVLPLLAFLAENYDHSLLGKYEGMRRDLGTLVPVSPYAHYAWSKVYRRLGREEDAVRELVAGLKLLDPAAVCASGGAALLGHLVSMLIDLNLGAIGKIVYEQHLDRCLSAVGDELVDRYRRNRMDRAGRLAIRCGEIASAFAYFRRMRIETQRAGRDDLRELAWLLYIAAWAGLKEGRTLALEALARLENVPVIMAGLGRGNESEAYLMRAVALWAWRAGDAAGVRALVPYVSEMEHRLYTHDPAPYAGALLWLHLCNAVDMSLKSRLPEWEPICDRLEDMHSWLELAAFTRIRGDPDESRSYLAKFQAMRVRLLPQLLEVPGWLIADDLARWKHNVHQSTQVENSVFSENLPDRFVVRLVQCGLIPL
jgi:tetratricopeptide (TPR) repeat protein